MYHVYGAYNDSIMYSLYTGNWCVDIAVLSASSAPLEHYTTLSQWTIDDKNVSPISVCLIRKLIHILWVSLAFLHNCKYYTGMHAHERGRSNWIDSRYMPSQRSRWRCMVNWPVERISALHDCHTVTVLNEWLHKMNMHPGASAGGNCEEWCTPLTPSTTSSWNAHERTSDEPSATSAKNSYSRLHHSPRSRVCGGRW